MNKSKLKLIVQNAMIAGIYAICTLLIQPLAYREIQFRISEIIVLLAFYNKSFIPGLTIGCFIANIPSSLGIIDWIVGPAATFIATILMNKSPNKYIASFMCSLVNGIFVGAELSIVYDLPFLLNAIYVFVGEALVLIIGVIIFNQLEKNKRFMELIRQ